MRFGITLFFSLFALDRITKLIALFMSPPALTFNPKAFFLFDGSTIAFVTLALLIAVLGAWFIHELRTRSRENDPIISAAALIVAGALSNFLDRVRYGAIIDWIPLQGITVFNFADVYIVAGCALVVASFFSRKKV